MPSVLFLHFAYMKKDMSSDIRRTAGYLEIPIDETKWPGMMEFRSFDYSKANATRSARLDGTFWGPAR